MSELFGRPAPRWLTIPAHRPFLDDLAAALWRELSPGGPEALADALILLPTRRAARALADSFLKAAGARAAILPQIRVLGDLDEGEPPFEAGDLSLDLPPAITPQRRRFELAGLVAAYQDLLGRRLEASGALELADALAAFLDTWQIEEPDLGADLVFQDLAEGEFARHWRISAAFLDMALKTWPARLEALGVMDIAARRIALLRRLARDWTARPPMGVVVAAGSTGSAPASAALLAAIGQAPRGAVVLPGLDLDLAEKAWLEVEDQHPQGAMRRLLTKAEISRGDVAYLDPSTAAQSRGRWRRRLINEALRPPDATADWLGVIERLRAAAARDPGDARQDRRLHLSGHRSGAAGERATAPLEHRRRLLGGTALGRQPPGRLGRAGVEGGGGSVRPRDAPGHHQTPSRHAGPGRTRSRQRARGLGAMGTSRAPARDIRGPEHASG
jgi:ATP-dependent helicase/nuclease subunit B